MKPLLKNEKRRNFWNQSSWNNNNKKDFFLVDVMAMHRMVELSTKEHRNLSDKEGNSKGSKTEKFF
jgi:hypothetical protein